MMQSITFKNLLGYMNEKELAESIGDTPYALASAIINQLGLIPAYSDENQTHDVDANYSWKVYDLGSKYVELHTSVGGSFVNSYDTLEELIDINNNWLEYSEEDDEFVNIENEEN